MTAVTEVPARSGAVAAWVGIGTGIVVLAGVLAAIASISQLPAQGLLDPEAAGTNGARAVATILEEQGVDVTVVRGAEQLEREMGDGDDTTLVITDTSPLADADLSDLLDAADDVVLVDPWTRDIRLAFGGDLAGIGDGTVGPGCDLPDARRAGAVTIGTGFDVPSTANRCYPVGDGFGVVAEDRGDGRLVAIDGTAVMINERLATAGNAALALNLLGRHDSLVWYVPDYGDSDEFAPPPSFAELTPPWVTPVMVLLLLSGVAAAVWRGRRLGPLVAENLPVTVRAGETTAGRARLYARSGDATHAADQLRIGALRRMARLLGLGPAASALEIADAVAGRLGADRAVIRGILITDPSPTDRDLVDLADRVRSLENAVTRAVRPERNLP